MQFSSRTESWIFRATVQLRPVAYHWWSAGKSAAASAPPAVSRRTWRWRSWTTQPASPCPWGRKGNYWWEGLPSWSVTAVDTWAILHINYKFRCWKCLHAEPLQDTLETMRRTPALSTLRAGLRQGILATSIRTGSCSWWIGSRSSSSTRAIRFGVWWLPLVFRFQNKCQDRVFRGWWFAPVCWTLQVPPAELELVLQTLPEVVDAAVMPWVH